MEWVRNVRGIDFINDSKATTVESAIWALNILDKPVIMIVGGKDKGLDYAPIRNLIKDKAKEVVLIGEAREKIRKALTGSTDLKEAGSLKEAVELAMGDARNGDCVLLSPMCASFDMFANFEERGRVFKEIVNNL